MKTKLFILLILITGLCKAQSLKDSTHTYTISSHYPQAYLYLNLPAGAMNFDSVPIFIQGDTMRIIRMLLNTAKFQ